MRCTQHALLDDADLRATCHTTSRAFDSHAAHSTLARTAHAHTDQTHTAARQDTHTKHLTPRCDMPAEVRAVDARVAEAIAHSHARSTLERTPERTHACTNTHAHTHRVLHHFTRRMMGLLKRRPGVGNGSRWLAGTCIWCCWGGREGRQRTRHVEASVLCRPLPRLGSEFTEGSRPVATS